MLEEKDKKKYALQVLRYLCQHGNDSLCVNEIYKNSGVNIHFERDPAADADTGGEKNGSSEDAHIKVFEQVIKYLVDKEFLSHHVMPSEINEYKFQDLHKTQKLKDTCGKVLVSSLKQYEADIFG